MNERQKIEDQENFAEMLARHDALSGKLQTGQKIKGTIIAVSGDSVFVDVGIKVDGIMDYKEILDSEGQEKFAAGDEIEAWIVGISSQGIRLSHSMLGSGIAALEDAMESGLPVEGRVKGVCKGGYQVDVLGKTAFCPGSQMDIAAKDAPEEAVGRHMQFLITKIENRGRNIVVSHRALIERERKENLDKLLESLNIGDTVEGKVARLAAFGAFVELAPSVEGMIHLSELSWSRVGSADEAVSPGDLVRVKVIGINQDDKGQTRIALSRKQAEGDPWEGIGQRFTAGDVVAGRTVRLAPFGAFVEIAPGVEGLIHLSEMSWAKRIVKPEEALSPGDAVEVKIKEINPEARRISLSLREALGDPWADAAEKFGPGTRISGTVESRGQYGIFVSLAPGVTGLLPQSAIKNDQARFSKLGRGDKADFIIQKVDAEARRISLLPAEAENNETAADESWRGHAKMAAPASDGNFGIMAQALQKAFKKK